MNPLNFSRVRNPDLSLWQSTVAEGIRNQIRVGDAPVNHLDVLKHPLSIATGTYVDAVMKDGGFSPQPPPSNEGQEALVYLSHLGFHIGQALSKDEQAAADLLFTEYRKFSNLDPRFLELPFIYEKYKKATNGHMAYNDWTVQGNNNINFGVIDWKLPNDARVAILGDWGTGMPDAVALLKDVMIKHQPQAIIHLGDIYYAGTPSECQDYFAGVFQQVFDEVLGVGNRIPVFSIPGNHDYYAWGAGFYPMLAQLNNYPNITNAVQPASYFCLRTEDMGWQFLGMDTGYHDSNPLNQVDLFYAGPWLENTEIKWHRDKLQNFGGATIMLSHHQLFSANSAINGKLSAYHDIAYFDPFIYSAVWDYLPTKIAGWLWGHEHNFVMYENNSFGLSKGRLLGNSAYEEFVSSDSYKINYPEVAYLVPEPQYDQYKLGTTADSNGVTYYNHGYGIIDFGTRKSPTDQVEVSYYQFPSWGDLPPINPQSSVIFTEHYSLPNPPTKSIVNSGSLFKLMCQEGLLLSSTDKSLGTYYPTLSTVSDTAKQVYLQKWANGVAQSGAILDGDVVSINIVKDLPTSPNVMTAGFTHSLYYKNSVESNHNLWTIHKRDIVNNDTMIHLSDAIYFVSQEYTGQWLIPSYSALYGKIYLTTKADVDYYWTALSNS